MEILKQNLVWHDGKEPSADGEKLIYYKRNGISGISIINFDKPLDGKFAGYDIIAWAHIDAKEIDMSITNGRFNKNWLEFLNQNATK